MQARTVRDRVRKSKSQHGRRLLALIVAVLAVDMAAAWGQRSINPPPELGWRGIVKALHQPALTSDLSAKISAIRFREGERFSAGDVLVEFDCRRLDQEAKALAAMVREAGIAVDTNRYLAQRGASNNNDVGVALARHDKAKAEQAALEQRLTGCKINAPFDGIVTEIGVAAHEIPVPNRMLMTIASIDQMEIELIVPSRVMMRLDAGMRLIFAVDETGDQHSAIVLRRGGAVDSVSQTGKIYAAFVGTPRHVLPGMSGTAAADTGAP